MRAFKFQLYPFHDHTFLLYATWHFLIFSEAFLNFLARDELFSSYLSSEFLFSSYQSNPTFITLQVFSSQIGLIVGLQKFGRFFAHATFYFLEIGLRNFRPTRNCNLAKIGFKILKNYVGIEALTYSVNLKLLTCK